MTFEQKQWVAIFLVIAVIEAALLYKLIAGTESQTQVIVGVCIIAIIFMLLLNVDALKSISVGWFKGEPERFSKMTFENDRAIAETINFSPMGTDVYKHLKKLATGSFGKYEKEPHMGLETELYYLQNIGFIELNKEKARSIHDIVEFVDDLSDYITVTDEGKRYIELREKAPQANGRKHQIQ